VETQVTFDPNALELINVTSNFGEVYDGVGWSTAKPVPGGNDHIVVATAALGEIASFVGDFTMATITFRWIANRIPETSLGIESCRFADVFGNQSEGEGFVLNFGASGVIPTEYALYQNYPNPFNSTTTIRYDLSESGWVTMRVFNVLGQSVVTLVNSEMPAGRHAVDLDASTLTSGLYIYIIQANSFSDRKKLLMLK
jgi:hypothetical protein